MKIKRVSKKDLKKLSNNVLMDLIINYQKMINIQCKKEENLKKQIELNKEQIKLLEIAAYPILYGRKRKCQ